MTSWQKLSPREQEVARLLMTGKTNKEVAILLSVSHRTVEVHRARIFDKLRVKNLVELMRIKQGEVAPPAVKADTRLYQSSVVGAIVQVKTLMETASEIKGTLEALLMEMEG